MSIFHNPLSVWHDEMRTLFRDEGVLIFFIVVPLVYPLLYSWIYNNEVVRDVPVAVVDDSHSARSREFIRRCDASPDVRIFCHAQDMDEARSLVSRSLVKGIYYLPADFDTRLGRMEQATVGVYCDMSLMLAYKAVYQTALSVSMDMGSELTSRLGGHYTARDEELSAAPLRCEAVPIFNPTGGYGSFILPGVLILIIQQTLVLGIGLAAGTSREENGGRLIPTRRPYHNVGNVVAGRALAYMMVYAVMSAWLLLAVPRLFGFLQLAGWQSLLALALPYLLACIFFGMTVSCLVRYRENVMLLIVFVSVPLLFLSGAVSWPQSSMPGLWQGVSWLFPSTFGIRAYIRLNSMGATLGDVLPELRCLWAQAAVYLAAALTVYRREIRSALPG